MTASLLADIPLKLEEGEGSSEIDIPPWFSAAVPPNPYCITCSYFLKEFKLYVVTISHGSV